jgi:hypothetical protein
VATAPDTLATLFRELEVTFMFMINVVILFFGYSETVISNILSSFYRLQKIVPVFGLYAIPFKTSAVVFLTIF